jgi:hypothetical protein
MTEVEFAKDIEAVCRRPKLYTPNGTFFEIYCFLDGFGIGGLENRGSHSSFTPFLNWLAEPDEKVRNFPMSLHKFREQFSSDEEALMKFASLFRQYVESKNK